MSNKILRLIAQKYKQISITAAKLLHIFNITKNNPTFFKKLLKYFPKQTQRAHLLHLAPL